MLASDERIHRLLNNTREPHPSAGGAILVRRPSGDLELGTEATTRHRLAEGGGLCAEGA